MVNVEDIETKLDVLAADEKLQALIQLACYYNETLPAKCLEYGKQALSLAEQGGNLNDLMIILEYMGGAFERLNDFESALAVYRKALCAAEKACSSQSMAQPLYHIGKILEQKKEYRESVTCLIKALEYLDATGCEPVTADCFHILGLNSRALGQYDAALAYFMKSIALREKLGDASGYSDDLHNAGIIHWHLCNYDHALEYYLQALDIKEKTGETKKIANILNNIGVIHKNLGNYQKALEYLFKAHEIKVNMGGKSDVADSFNNIGLVYKHMGQFEESLKYHQKSLSLREETADKKGISYSLNNIGNIYKEVKKYDESLKHLLKSLELKKELDDKLGIANSSNNVGSVYIEIKDYENAFKYLEQGLKYALEINAKEFLQDSYRYYSRLYSNMDNYRKALEYYKLYEQTKDSIFTEDSSKKIAEMQTKYETEKKEKEAEIYRLRNVELAEANQAITQSKEIIEEKNRHITSSIEYARRIQQAVLPPAGKMQAALPEHFVLFKPRDIVSGDFYWFSQTGGKTLIAVVDCTGHGVPGAFMSMIGSMLLNTIVNENGETGPANVLEQLHVAVRHALKQHDAEADTTDGMDVCLCAIEQGSKWLVYAGAKRPLYLVRNKELTEIAGDGKSIGGRQKEEKRSFSDKQIELQKGDMLYLTSDGYADQCDPDGRKIGSRSLKELLTEISCQDQEAQRTALLSELKSHQGAEEQRDDIAVIGVRIVANG